MKYINKRYSNRQIHIGLVASCKANTEYGLLHGQNKLLYFEKDPNLEIAVNTLVSYLSFDFKEFSSKVDYVYPLSALVKHRDKRGTCRADNIYHDDEAWRLINEGIPYVDFESGRNCCIYYPIIEDDTCTIWEGLLGCGIYVHGEWYIYEMYNELSSINYNGWPTLEEVTNAVIGFKKHIDSINVFEIIDTFEIMKIGRYISRPGKDDHYFEDLYQSLPNDDKYLSYLLPTKKENIFFDDNAYRSDGYKDGFQLLKEETAQAREKAKTEYSKEKHLAFLISDFFSNVMEKKEKAALLKKRIVEEFHVDNACEITAKFKGMITDDFVTLINKYNESTVIGHL